MRLCLRPSPFLSPSLSPHRHNQQSPLPTPLPLATSCQMQWLQCRSLHPRPHGKERPPPPPPMELPTSWPSAPPGRHPIKRRDRHNGGYNLSNLISRTGIDLLFIVVIIASPGGSLILGIPLSSAREVGAGQTANAAAGAPPVGQPHPRE
jgi:hypothetical protein